MMAATKEELSQLFFPSWTISPTSSMSQSYFRSPATTMDNVSAIDVISRFIHVAAAVVMVGGTVFMRFILLPAAAELPQAEHDQLRQRLLARWKRVVHSGIALLLLSGGYNFWLAIRLHKGDGLYHGLVGTKILLALAVFLIASALVGRSAAFEKLRQNRARWMGVIVLLAAVIVGLSAFVKVRGVVTKPLDKIEVQKTN